MKLAIFFFMENGMSSLKPKVKGIEKRIETIKSARQINLLRIY